MDIGGRSEDSLETAKHPLRTADDLSSESRIGLIEPSGSTDAAGDGIKLGNADAVFGDQQVRSDDARHLVFECGGTLPLEQGFGLSLVEPAGDPFGLFGLGALPMEQINPAVKLKQNTS